MDHRQLEKSTKVPRMLALSASKLDVLLKPSHSLPSMSATASPNLKCSPAQSTTSLVQGLLR